MIISKILSGETVCDPINGFRTNQFDSQSTRLYCRNIQVRQTSDSADASRQRRQQVERGLNAVGNALRPSNIQSSINRTFNLR